MRRIHSQAHQKLKTWGIQHEFLLNYVLIHPFAKLSELAKVTGFTTSWLSVIINGALFQKRLSKALPQIYAIPIDEFHRELMKGNIRYDNQNPRSSAHHLPNKREHG